LWALALCGAVVGLVRAAVEHVEISSSGPLESIFVGADGSVQVAHVDDKDFAFFPKNTAPGDAGTFLVVDGVLYAPDFANHSGDTTTGTHELGTYTAFTPVSQSEVKGAGTETDPYRVLTVVDAGTSGVRVAQTDSYVVGKEWYRTDVRLLNTGHSPRSITLYRAADCYLGGSDRGYGVVEQSSGAVACATTANNSPPDRIEQLLPITSGSSYYEAHFSEVWERIGSKQPFPNSCECAEEVDNGVGLSWSLELGPQAEATRSHLTTFSPAGVLPLTISKSADFPTSSPGATNGYTIRVSNPNNTAVTLASIVDMLPDGFTYVVGSTTGAIQQDPSISGRTLTWAGPVNVPALGTAQLHFDVRVALAPGVYTNSASATAAGGFTVAPTGDAAPISILPTPTPTATACPTATPLVLGAAVAGQNLRTPTVLPRTPPPGVRPASHFRSTQLNWTRLGPTTAEFELTTSAELTFFPGLPRIGDSIKPIFVSLGDAFPFPSRVEPELTVVFVDVANNYLIAEGSFRHTYAGTGPYTAAAEDCCRLKAESHINNPEGGIRVESLVNLAAATGSAVSSIQPIVDCPRNGICSFVVPAVAPNGGTLRYRMSNPTEAADPMRGFVQPGPPYAPNSATIDPTTGLYRWDTNGATVNAAGDTLYSTQVAIETVVGSTVVAKTAVDFFIRLNPAAVNQPPAFLAGTPADGATVNMLRGQTLIFEAAANDPNLSDLVTLTILGLPPSAAFTTTPANPAHGTFTWTPTTAGSTILTLGARDQTGLGATPRSLTIQVFGDPCLVLPTATPTLSATPTASPTSPGGPDPGSTPSLEPTHTLVPTMTASPSSTSTPTPTPTRTGTPTPTATVGTAGGRDLRLTGQGDLASPSVRLDWVTGSVETGSYVIRVAPDGLAILNPQPLASGVGHFTDGAPATNGFGCYLVLGVKGTPPDRAGISDLLCTLAGSRSPLGAPSDFSVSLNQSATATLTWNSPLGAAGTHYLLVVLAGDAPPRVLERTATQTSVTDNTNGMPACYVVLAISGATVLGNSDFHCVIPGISAFP
jgi:uncharacterized repeat protein (TIGR01451 family)